MPDDDYMTGNCAAWALAHQREYPHLRMGIDWEHVGKGHPEWEPTMEDNYLDPSDPDEQDHVFRWPQHVFTHDDHHAYDASGAHPLSGFGEWSEVTLNHSPDSAKSIAEGAGIRGNEPPPELVRRVPPHTAARLAGISDSPDDVTGDYTFAEFLQWCAVNRQRPTRDNLAQYAAVSGMDTEDYLDLYLFLDPGLLRQAARVAMPWSPEEAKAIRQDKSHPHYWNVPHDPQNLPVSTPDEKNSSSPEFLHRGIRVKGPLRPGQLFQLLKDGIGSHFTSDIQNAAAFGDPANHDEDHDYPGAASYPGPKDHGLMFTIRHPGQDALITNPDGAHVNAHYWDDEHEHTLRPDTPIQVHQVYLKTPGSQDWTPLKAPGGHCHHRAGQG
jgi:hypothetical protein